MVLPYCPPPLPPGLTVLFFRRLGPILQGLLRRPFIFTVLSRGPPQEFGLGSTLNDSESEFSPPEPGRCNTAVDRHSGPRGPRWLSR